VRAPVFIGSAFVAQYPSGGGIYWIPLQYVLGLKELGREVYWLELLWTRGDPAVDRECIDAFLRFAREYGVSDQLALLYFPEGTRDEPVDRVEHVGMSAAAFAERQRDGLLLNLANSITAPLRAGFGRTALLDLDPGTFQLWAREWDMGVGSHDAHLTIGMNLGAPDSPIPLDGVAWSRVWPVVHLGSWPVQPLPAPGAPYTTVTQWWNNHYAFLDGDTYDCNKRSGFLPLLPLAKRVAPRLEIAANLHVDETEDRALRLAAGRPGRGRGHAGGLPALRAGIAGRAQRDEARLREGARRMDQRSHGLLPGQRAAVHRRGDGCRGAPAGESRTAYLLHGGRGGGRRPCGRGRLRRRVARRAGARRGGVRGPRGPSRAPGCRRRLTPEPSPR